MLVISDPVFLQTMQEFVDWKNIKGVPTELVNVSNITTPKGRQNKRSNGFNFKQKKLDFSDHNVPTSSNNMNPQNQ